MTETIIILALIALVATLLMRVVPKVRERLSRARDTRILNGVVYGKYEGMSIRETIEADFMRLDMIEDAIKEREQ